LKLLVEVLVPSVAVQVTFVEPTANWLPEAGVQVAVPLPATASVVPGEV